MVNNAKNSLPRMLLAASLALLLTACSPAGPSNAGTAPTDSGTAAEDSGTPPADSGTSSESGMPTQDTAPDETPASAALNNGGIELPVPPEYMDLLVIETPQDSEDGILFSVSEKASIEAAKAQGEEFEGAGWLFSIARISEDAFHETLCCDMSGAEVFAKDGDDHYYMYYHPTDVRLVREDYQDQESLEQWTELCEWAASVPEDVRTANPGLSAEKRGNTELDIRLARIAYMGDTSYTISTTEFGPMEPRNTDPAPYCERLMRNAAFEYADEREAPDGEYVVLYFPESDFYSEMRFDFFLMEGQENTIRFVWGEEDEVFYKASFEDSTETASGIMLEWYHALAAAN